MVIDTLRAGHQSQLEIGLSPLGDPTPSSRLLEYVQASLRPGASQFDLHLTVLIKGARGSGKRTLARAIARRTGFHLLEVSSSWCDIRVN